MIKYKHRTAIRKLDTSRKSDLHTTEKRFQSHTPRTFSKSNRSTKVSKYKQKGYICDKVKTRGFTSIRIALNFQ